MLLSIKEIRKLYYSNGFSANEIATIKKLTVWQIIKFMKKNNLPRRKSNESNNLRFERQEKSFKLKSELSPMEEKIKISSCMLYWAEGVKSVNGHAVDFVNSDPEMISIFLKFLRDICGASEKKLRVLLYCYADQNCEELLDYWSNLTKIPKEQFQKPYIRKDFNPNGRKMVRGLVHIRYNDKKLYRQLLDWINEYKNL